MPPPQPLPRELHVYECRGARTPRSEPEGPGYLGVWPEPPYRYLFFDRPAQPAVEGWLRGEAGWELVSTYRMDYVDWQDTADEDQAQVGPFVLVWGPGGVVGPRNGMIIRLGPGVSFGSGLHPSTRGCLLALSQLYPRSIPGTVIDYGTGSGILALACARLGAAPVWAFDCNLLAVREATANIRRNSLEGTVHVFAADGLRNLRVRADLLLMNLEWVSLTRALRTEDLGRFRRLLLSGFLSSKYGELESALRGRFKVQHRVEVDDWLTIVMTTAGD